MGVLQLYCERRGDGLFAEPLNAVTNVAFFVAAVIAWRLVWRAWGGRVPGDFVAAVALLVAIGAGSLLWHTVAAPWAQMADVAPIGALVFVLLGSVVARLFARPRGFVVGVLVGFAFAHVPVVALFPQALGGSSMYLPAWAALSALALLARRSDRTSARAAAGGLAASAALLTVSLMLRTLDLPLCPSWKAGTHFAWHLVNATLLLVLIVTVARAATGSQQVTTRQAAT